jgi:glucarate dehydratase
MLDRRAFVSLSAGSLLAWPQATAAAQSDSTTGPVSEPLRIKAMKVTPIALADPPLLAAGGCHGPYFLRNVVQLETDAGIVGIGETKGDESVTADLDKARALILGKNVFAYREFARALTALSPACYAAVELACLDAAGHALKRPLCELLGGPVRNEVEFAAYLFFRFAADHKQVLTDPRLKDDRGSGSTALDDWGEVRTPAAMAELAAKFRQQFGFRVFKLKAGVLPPNEEVAALKAINERFQGKYLLRIDPNARWTPATAIKVAKEIRPLPLEYYEDPVAGQDAMAEIRRQTGLPMSTNMCVTRLEHIPDAVRKVPIDFILCDHHNFGGMIGCQALGQMADVLGWRVSQHSNNHAGVTMAAMLHVGAVVPQLTIASDTHYPWLPETWDIIEGGKLPIRDGRMQVPTGPGVGVQLDPDRLARAHEIYLKCGMRSRDDAETMQRFQPGWTRTLF